MPGGPPFLLVRIERTETTRDSLHTPFLRESRTKSTKVWGKRNPVSASELAGAETSETEVSWVVGGTLVMASFQLGTRKRVGGQGGSRRYGLNRDWASGLLQPLRLHGAGSAMSFGYCCLSWRFALMECGGQVRVPRICDLAISLGANGGWLMQHYRWCLAASFSSRAVMHAPR
jgi:hypothetical protein